MLYINTLFQARLFLFEKTYFSKHGQGISLKEIVQHKDGVVIKY